jgi:hypothetical protein
MSMSQLGLASLRRKLSKDIKGFERVVRGCRQGKMSQTPRNSADIIPIPSLDVIFDVEGARVRP